MIICKSTEEDQAEKKLQKIRKSYIMSPDVCRLSFMEALLIFEKKPTLSTTNEVLLLPSLKNRIQVGRTNIQISLIAEEERNNQGENNQDETQETNNDRPPAASVPASRYALRSRTRLNPQ